MLNIKFLILFPYIIFLGYNLIFCKWNSIVVSLVLLFLGIYMERIFPYLKKLKQILLIIIIILVTKDFLISNKNIIPQEEQNYINITLSKINKNSTKDDLINLFGKPDRIFIHKMNWWVDINGKKSRVGIYFVKGKINKVVFDGGYGRFYFVKNISINQGGKL